jgi:hypothetical protein
MLRFAFVRLLFASLALAGCAGVGGSSAEQGVRDFMAGVFDRPDARLTVPSVAFAGDYAVAGWLQSGRGGRTLLRRSPEGWEFVVCGGADLTTLKGLREAGLPEGLRPAMVTAIGRAEASLTSEQLRLLGDFPGMLRMEGVHPPPKR